MKKFRGLSVPVEPKKAWRSWMTGSAFCGMRDGAVDCNSLDCRDCIYSMVNWEKRVQFYKDFFNGKKSPVHVYTLSEALRAASKINITIKVNND